MDQETRPNSNLGAFGCVLVAMGLISAVAGVAALLGISPVRNDIELEFFGIEVDTPGERFWWVLGSLIALVVGVFLMRANKRGT